MKAKHLLFFLFFLIISSFVFKNLLLNMGSLLLDWRDYAVLAWTISQNITHITSLDFQNLFNLGAFYPYTNTLFLSDTLITQSIIGIPFSIYTNSPVLIFNIIFFITFILNYISSYIFFNKLFKKEILAFTGGVVMVFSPFFVTEIGHFQMQNYWPLMLILSLLVGSETKRFIPKQILIGLLLAIQFLASVYLAFFSAFILFVFYAIEIIREHNIKQIFIKFGVVIFTFLIIDGVFIKGYIDAKKNFEVNRNTSEYLTYSARISDYFFPSQKGILYQNKFVRKWKSYNKHLYGEPVSFPGFVLGMFAILGLIRISFAKNIFSVNFSTKRSDALFSVIMLIGFIFSLGYPYLPFVKFLPLFDTIRGVSRWSFLFYLGLVYYSISFISKIKTKWISIFAIVVILLDVLPSKLNIEVDHYLTQNDYVLKNICESKKTIILAVPVTHFDAGTDIAKGLSYITKTLLASSYNKCILVNGYSSYDLPSIQNIKNNLILSSQADDLDLFYSTLKSTKADLLSVNLNELQPNVYPNLIKTINQLEKAKKIQHVGAGVYKIN